MFSYVVGDFPRRVNEHGSSLLMTDALANIPLAADPWASGSA